MIVILALRWWYSAGWQWAWHRSVSQRIQWCLEAFSLKQLVKTWFSPFKQTYSSGRKGSIDIRIQSMIDNFVSRIIGSLARSLIIFAGVLCMFLAFVSGIVILLIWPLFPALPLIGVLLSLSGVIL